MLIFVKLYCLFVRPCFSLTFVRCDDECADGKCRGMSAYLSDGIDAITIIKKNTTIDIRTKKERKMMMMMMKERSYERG